MLREPNPRRYLVVFVGESVPAANGTALCPGKYCHVTHSRAEKRPPIYRTADPRRWAVGCAGNRDSALPGLSGSLIPAGYQLVCRQRFPGGIAAGSSPETARSLPAAPAGRGNTGAAIDRDPRKHCRPEEACCPSTVAGTGRKPRASSAPSLSSRVRRPPAGGNRLRRPELPRPVSAPARDPGTNGKKQQAYFSPEKGTLRETACLQSGRGRTFRSIPPPPISDFAGGPTAVPPPFKGACPPRLMLPALKRHGFGALFRILGYT